MNILVTGGTGFVGAEVVRQLVTKGHEPVVFRSSEAKKRLYDIEDKVTLVRGNLGNFSHVLSAVKNYDIEVIYHLGSRLSVPSEEDPWTSFDVNAKGTFHVLETARLFGVKQVIFSSSRSTYGIDIKGDTIDESSLQRPTNFYGITKVFAELMGRYYRNRFGLDFRGVRPPSVIGPGVRTPGVVQWTSWAIEEAYKGNPFTIWVGPETTYPSLYYKDVAAGIIQLAEAPKENIKTVVYNLGGIEPLFSAQELVEEVKKYFPDARIDFKLDTSGARRDRLLVPANTNDRPAREEWGWQPQYSLRELVTDFIQELKSHPEQYD